MRVHNSYVGFDGYGVFSEFLGVSRRRMQPKWRAAAREALRFRAPGRFRFKLVRSEFFTQVLT